MHCVLQVCWSCRKYLDNIVENQLESLLRSEIHDLQQIFVRSVIKIHVWLPSHNIDHFWVKKWQIFPQYRNCSLLSNILSPAASFYITVWYHQSVIYHSVILSQCDIITVWYYHTPVRHVWSPRFMFTSGISCTDQILEIWSVSMFVAGDLTKWQCCNI